jgi:hypothetical protein
LISPIGIFRTTGTASPLSGRIRARSTITRTFRQPATDGRGTRGVDPRSRAPRPDAYGSGR